MFAILQNRTFRNLFTAQIVALLGTGLLTIALGLLAFDLAGGNAGQVLGLALTIKMVAYVVLSPLTTALTAKMNRRAVLIAADLIRAAAALALPFVDAIWQIYALIFVLQAASATFTPTFQAVIPEVLPDEAGYTRALSLSRLAYDIENLVSPVLAGLLLLVLAPNALFAGTAVGFLLSAWIVLRTSLPPRAAGADRPFLQRVTRGVRIYLATPRLRGLLALNACVAATTGVVLVLSVVIARQIYAGDERALAVLLAAYGLGSMLMALALPRVLDQVPDRPVMLTAGAALALLICGLGLLVVLQDWPSWAWLLAFWCALGLSNAGLMTPSGRLLKRSAHSEDRPAIFAAQFALSHACWLLSYPLIGFLSVGIGVALTVLVIGGLGVCAVCLAWRIWPSGSAAELSHSHDDLPADHPHLADAVKRDGKWEHRHSVVIDDLHRIWPTNG